MSPPHRAPITRPALWIAVPTFVVSLAVATSLQGGIFAALVVGLIGAALVGTFAETRLTGIISSIDRIARGDRYTLLPEMVGDGAIRQFAGTAETARAALIEADTVSVDQSRRETEARLHHAGRLFLHRQFLPCGGRSGRHFHQCRRAHPVHRHRARREQPRHDAAGDGGLRRRSSSRRGSRRRCRGGARRRDAGDEFSAAGGRGAPSDQAHRHRIGAPTPPCTRWPRYHSLASFTRPRRRRLAKPGSGMQ